MLSTSREREYKSDMIWVKLFLIFRKSKKEQPYPLKKVVSLDELTENDKKKPLSVNGKDILFSIFFGMTDSNFARDLKTWVFNNHFSKLLQC